MSDQDPNTPDPSDEPNGPAQLREAAERGRQATAERDALARENAMLRAGVDLDSPLGAMFSRGYDGELTAEAIKAAYGVIAPPPPPAQDPEVPPTTPPPTPEETSQQSERNALGANGAPPSEPETADPTESGYEAFFGRIRAGARREDAASEVWSRKFDAADKGDQRVLHDPARWREEFDTRQAPAPQQVQG